VPHFADYAIEDVMESEVFKDTNAVKNGDVYLFPSGLEPWYENTAAACLGGCWALYNLYPEVYSFKNLKSTIETYYKTVYGKNCDLNALGIE
jgi:iron complex transport system substrate-binding protein